MTCNRFDPLCPAPWGEGELVPDDAQQASSEAGAVTAARDAVLEEIDGYIDAAGTGLSRTDQIVKEKAKWKAEARELVERYEQAVRRDAIVDYEKVSLSLQRTIHDGYCPDQQGTQHSGACLAAKAFWPMFDALPKARRVAREAQR